MRLTLRHVCLFLLCLALPWSARAQVTLVLSESTAAYQEVAAGFQSGYAGAEPVSVVNLAALSEGQLHQLTAGRGLVVPVGLKAAQAVAEVHAGGSAVLTLLLPRSAFASLPWPAALQQSRRLSALYLDQPLPRLFAAIEAALPSARRVGVVLSGENSGLVSELRSEAARRQLGLNLEVIRAADDIAPALRQVLPGSDVLLLLPDSVVVNAASIQNILLTSYRYRVPAVGFSQGLVRAGAAIAVYTGLQQMGRAGGEMARLWNPASGALPAPQYPRDYALATNSQVLRSLLIALPEESETLRRIGARE